MSPFFGAMAAVLALTGVALLLQRPLGSVLAAASRKWRPAIRRTSLVTCGVFCLVAVASLTISRWGWEDDYRHQAFRVLLWNNTADAVTVYGCSTSDCATGELSDPQATPPGTDAYGGTEVGGGGERYLIVNAHSGRRTCVELDFQSRFDDIRIPISDATEC